MTLRKVNLQLAAMLLINDGQLSVDEIKALPFVESREEALSIAREVANALSDQYDMHQEEGDRLVISGLASPHM